MPHAKTGMASFLDVVLRTPETENQEIAEALLGAGKILLRVKGP